MAERKNSDDPPTKDKVHKCKVCKIKCPDIQSYVEHLESKEHTKGIMKEKYGEKYLVAKAKLENIPKAQIMNVPEETPVLPDKNPKSNIPEEKPVLPDKNPKSNIPEEKPVLPDKNPKSNIPEEKPVLPDKNPKSNIPEEKPVLPDKNPKPKLENDNSSESSDENDDVYTCEICRKICTGFLSYQLHLEGQKHQKNLRKAKLLKQMKENNLIPKPSKEKPPEEQSLLDRIMTNTQFASSDIECKTCQKKCCGPEAFKQHCKSAAHQKKLAMQSLLEEMKSEGVSPPPHDEDSPFAHCDVCQKNFSGLLPYQQHMESITHLKQARHVEQLLKIKDLIVNSEEDSRQFQCKECGKTFSGPVPFNAHLKSFAHEKLKKKSAQMEDLQKKHPEMVKIPMQQDSESDSDEEDGVLLGCDVCRLVCSGPETARDHFASAKHKKAVKKKSQFRKYMKQQKGKILTGASGSQKKLKAAKLSQKTDSSDSDSEFDIISEA